jgi:transcriptional regulator with XRE-family HTH domain
MSTHRHPNTLAAFRKQRGLVQADAARLIGSTAQRISDFERGRRQPNLGQAVALSIAYADSSDIPVPLDQLFPLLYARARMEAEKRANALARSRRQIRYAPKPNTTTVLALYTSRPQAIGMALFEAAHAH